MSARTSRGFVLPLALFAITLVSIAVVLMNEASWARQRQIRLSQEQLVADRAADTASARVAFLVAASPLAARSLEAPNVLARGRAGSDRSQRFALFLDGRLYEFPRMLEGGATVRFELQDEAGLVNLNGSDEATVSRLLELSGVTERMSGRLTASLLDYTDADDLDRLNGADGSAYSKAGLKPPRNRPIDAPVQAFSALGWAGALGKEETRTFLAAATALPPRSAFNPNTASLEALRSMLDVEESGAMRVRAMREKQLLLSTQEVRALSGSQRADLQIRAFPARSMRLVVTVFPTTSQESYVYVQRITVAQEGAEGPIEVTRLERPVRVSMRERARRHKNDPVVILPDFFGDGTARNR